MMTRNLRKVISIVCAVALVLSLGVVALTGTTSAYKLGDEPTGTSLNLDFENKTGIADYNGPESGYVADPEDPNNTVLKIVTGVNRDSRNFIPGKSADTVADFDAAKDAFELKPSTTYVVTFKLKVGAGSNKANLNRFYGQNSDKGGKTGQHLFYTPTIDATNGTLEGTDYCLNTDTAWEKVEYTFTTPAAFDIKDSKPNNHLVIVCQSSAVKNPNVYYFDDFTIDVVDEAIYEFDGEKGNTGEYWNTSKSDLLANSGDVGGSYVDAAGYHLRPTTSTAIGFGAMPTVNATSWMKPFQLRDPDLDDGNSGVVMQAGNKYLLTMKFKIANIDDNNKVRLAVVYVGDKDRGYTVIKYIGEYKSVTDWIYFETIIDGSTTPDGSNPYAGRPIIIAMANEKGTSGVCETLIESVKVHQFRDETFSVVKYNTNGGSYVASEVVADGTIINPPAPTNSDANKAFAGWYFDAEFKKAVPTNYAVDSDVTLYAKWVSEFVNITYVSNGKETIGKIAPGTALSRPERPNAKAFFVGWCTDKGLTNVVTKAPDQDCTLYAKFDHMYTSFNQGGYSDTSGSQFGIIKEPGNSKNNVMLLKQDANDGMNNFEVSVGDIAGAPAYELQPNTKYYISFRYKIAPTDFGGQISIYAGAKSAYSEDAPKRSTGCAIKWSEGTYKNGSDWLEATYYYETPDVMYGDRIYWTELKKIFFLLSGIKDGVNNTAPAEVMIDDLIIGPVTDKAPIGATAIKFNTNSTAYTPLYGYAGEKIVMPTDPTLSSHTFLGWYTDKQLSNKFTDTTFGTEDVTLYAKWKLEDWKMDFSVYSEASISGRFNVLDNKGNKYLQYKFEDGQATSTAGPTAYGRATFNLGNTSPYLANQGVTYIITFKYKVIEVTGTNPKINGVLCPKFSTWGGGSQNFGTAADLGAPTEEWRNGTLTLTPNNSMGSANHLGFCVNGDATVLFDDFEIKPDIDLANIYGTTIISFDSNGGSEIDAIGGNPGEKIVLPTQKPKRAGYIFKGWYTDKTCTQKFSETVFGEDSIQLVAGWALGKLTESFEELPISIQTQGISGAYTYYKDSVAGFDKANVKEGASSILRKADVTGTKGFTLCRDATMTLDEGSQYTLTMYVKPTNVGNAAGTINLISMSTNTSVGVPDATEVITTVGELKAGEWQKISYTFTAKKQFIGISSSEGNEIYFDAANVNIVGYVGTDTGDSSVSPFIIALMVVLAAGALLVTGKKVFSK